MDKTLKGLGVSPGTAIGPVRRMGTAVLGPGSEQIPTDRAPHEQERARDAARTVAAELTARGARAPHVRAALAAPSLDQCRMAAAAARGEDTPDQARDAAAAVLHAT
ncbi:phosphoenolpyruvate-utilizing N-terminal domain-containing protein [Streptomyces sp. NPDC000927]|uniref:phosphoenolpyruvate-utilizing N-terminal domain-containing protein n=1 Tax=Streptomyces sp. NPDC000927 TaxID=3154371 RepID=UPI00331C84EF